MTQPGATGSAPRDAERAALEERLRAFVGQPAATPDVARDPVNRQRAARFARSALVRR